MIQNVANINAARNTVCTRSGVSVCMYAHIQWDLYNPTLCGQQNCVRLQRLLDYQEILSMVYCGDHISHVVGLERMLDYRGSTAHANTTLYTCECSECALSNMYS